MANGWKLLLIFAIILLILLTIETLFFWWAYVVGSELLEKESVCSINVCAGDDYDAFSFDETTSICYCYNDGEIIYQEIIP